MKRMIKKLSFALMLCCIITLNSSIVYSKEIKKFIFSNEMQEQVNTKIKNELNTFAEENGISIVFDDIKYSIDFNLVNDEEELNKEIDELISNIENDLMINISTSTERSLSEISPLSLKNKGSYYIAKVECAVPAIGIAWINQDFTASCGGEMINGITLLGSSYKTGGSISSWKHVRSWYEISGNRKYAQINIKGVLTYLFKGSNLDMSATFMETVKVNNNNQLIHVCYDEYPK